MSVAGYPVLEDSLLTGLVKQFPYNQRRYPMLAFFRRRGYAADELVWDSITGGRGMAVLCTLDGEGNIIKRDGVKQGRATPTHMKEKTQLKNSELSLLRAPGATGAPGSTGNPEKANAAIARMTEKFTARQFERKNWLCTQAMVNGAITYASEAVNFTVNYGLTALTPPSTLWSDAAATIISDMQTAINEFADNAGVPPTHLFFNPKIFPTYIGKITEWKDHVKASPASADAVRRGMTEPFQIMSMAVTWHPMVGQYVNDSGNLVERWPVNQITLAAIDGAPSDAFEWGVLENMENGYTDSPTARSWLTSGDAQQIWVLAYDNGLPIIRDTSLVQTWAIAAP